MLALVVYSRKFCTKYSFIVQQMVGSNISNKQTSRRIPRDPVLEGLKKELITH